MSNNAQAAVLAAAPPASPSAAPPSTPQRPAAAAPSNLGTPQSAPPSQSVPRTQPPHYSSPRPSNGGPAPSSTHASPPPSRSAVPLEPRFDLSSSSGQRRFQRASSGRQSGDDEDQHRDCVAKEDYYDLKQKYDELMNHYIGTGGCSHVTDRESELERLRQKNADLQKALAQHRDSVPKRMYDALLDDHMRECNIAINSEKRLEPLYRERDQLRQENAELKEQVAMATGFLRRDHPAVQDALRELSINFRSNPAPTHVKRREASLATDLVDIHAAANKLAADAIALGVARFKYKAKEAQVQLDRKNAEQARHDKEDRLSEKEAALEAAREKKRRRLNQEQARLESRDTAATQQLHMLQDSYGPESFGSLADVLLMRQSAQARTSSGGKKRRGRSSSRQRRGSCYIDDEAEECNEEEEEEDYEQKDYED